MKNDLLLAIGCLGLAVATFLFIRARVEDYRRGQQFVRIRDQVITALLQHREALKKQNTTDDDKRNP